MEVRILPPLALRMVGVRPYSLCSVGNGPFTVWGVRSESGGWKLFFFFSPVPRCHVLAWAMCAVLWEVPRYLGCEAIIAPVIDHLVVVPLPPVTPTVIACLFWNPCSRAVTSDLNVPAHGSVYDRGLPM